MEEELPPFYGESGKFRKKMYPWSMCFLSHEVLQQTFIGHLMGRLMR